jgi:RimJ/RimL family protein N-acetyltransferase
MQTIISNGLLLRPFEGRDAPDFTMAARESAESVGRWMPWCHAGYADKDALEWFAVCRQGREAKTAYEFGIFSEDGAEFLGGAGLNEIKKQHAICNLGYWVRASKQRQQIATRCVQVLSRYAFDNLALNRVEIVVAVGNGPSDAVARKSGATFECVARNRLLIQGVPVAASVFSLVQVSHETFHAS